jgi:enamine deaminase RidA (YjgF/YER057c/UK114 family)
MSTSQNQTGSPAIAQPLAKYAPYRRAGDFIFLSGIIPVDPTTGLIVKGFDDISSEAADVIGRTGEFSVDMKQGPILAQSWYVLDSIRRTVEGLGGRMSDVSKLVQYFKNLDHFPYYSSVRKLFFPEVAPASTVVQVSAMLPTDDIVIEVEATVYLPTSMRA